MHFLTIKRMNKKRGIVHFQVLLFVALIVIFQGRIAFAEEQKLADGFDVNTLLLKVTLPEMTSVSKTISIKSSSGGDFSLEVEKVRGVGLSDYNFSLGRDERKIVEVNFDASSLEPGIYVGSIKISDRKETKALPLIFEIHSEDVIYGLNLDIPPRYTDISPGGKLIAQLKVFDLTADGGASAGLGSNRVDINYYVYSVKEGLISSESESIIVNREVQLTKTISLPGSIKEEEYVFGAAVKYSSSIATSSRIFRVSAPQKEPFFLDSNIIWILVIIIIFFLGIVFLFIYLIKDRDRMFIELRKYNEWEAKKQKELLLAQARALKDRKKFDEGKIERNVENRVKALKYKQEKRIQEFKKLRSKGSQEEMKKKLSEWKKSGYNTLALEYKLNGLSKKEMKEIMDKWKGKS